MYRIINYSFGFLLIYLFILEGNAADHIRILVGLALALVISGIAFMLNRISLDAIKSTVLVGVFSLGLGGWAVALAVVFFFISSALLTGLPKINATSPGRRYLPDETRRTGYQVLANGFWLMFFLIFWFITGIQSFFIAAIAVIAAANADTWATEIGQFKPGKTVHIRTLKTVEPGVDGGVSTKGFAAAVAGAFLISLFVFAEPAAGYPAGMMCIITITGFSGCLADSFIGAYLKDSSRIFKIPRDFSGTPAQFLNNLTNWAATGLAGILALIITQIIIG